MVVAALFEQIIPSYRGLTQDETIAAAINEDQIWQQQQQYHAMGDNSSSSKTTMTPAVTSSAATQVHGSASSRPSPARMTSMSTSLTQIPQQGPNMNFPSSMAAAATRQRRKRCKATKCLASLAADFDVVTDWIFYFHCIHEDQAYREEYQQQQQQNYQNSDQPPYLIPPILLRIILIVCILGTILWLTLATDGKVASPVLRLMGYDKLSMGYVLFLCVIVEDLPQVVLTFLVEDYFEEDGEFNNYALVNVIASLYDTLIKLAEAFDERADIVETGIWCKESLWAHKKKVTCVVPIPVPDDDNDEANGGAALGSSSSFRSASLSQMRRSSSRMHVTSMRASVRQNLLEEAKEIVSETKLPRLRFLSASKDQTVRLWDTSATMAGHKRSKCTRTFRGHSDGVSCIAFVQLSEKNRRLVECLNDTPVRDDKAGLSKLDAVTGPEKQNGSIVASEKAMYFLTGSYDGSVKLWNSASGRCCRSYNLPSYEGGLRAIKVTCIAYLGREDVIPQQSSHLSSFHVNTLSESTRELFVSGYKSGKIRMWNVLTEICLSVFDGHAGKIHSLCCLKSSNHFASGSEDGTVKVWTCESANESSGPLPVCLSASTDTEDASRPNDAEQAISQSHTMQSLATQQISQSALHTLVGHTGPVLSVASISLQVILTGSADRTARVWNIESGVCLRVFVGHTEAVTSVAVVDHVTFLTGSKDATIKVWDGLSATCIRTYTGHTAPVTSVSTTLQSGTFISASEDLTVKLWVFTAVTPIVNNDDGGTLNDLLGMDDSLACMTCQNNVDTNQPGDP